MRKLEFKRWSFIKIHQEVLSTCYDSKWSCWLKCTAKNSPRMTIKFSDISPRVPPAQDIKEYYDGLNQNKSTKMSTAKNTHALTRFSWKTLLYILCINKVTNSFSQMKMLNHTKMQNYSEIWMYRLSNTKDNPLACSTYWSVYW